MPARLLSFCVLLKYKASQIFLNKVYPKNDLASHKSGFVQHLSGTMALCGRRVGPMFSALDSRSSNLCCVLEQRTLFSQCLSSAVHVDGYQQI